MNIVLGWLKANVITVVFLVIMVVALVSLPIVSGKMNGKVQTKVEERLGKLSELEKLENTSVSIEGAPGTAPIDETILVNERLLDRYRAVSAKQSEDAKKVQAAALRHNQKERGVLMEGVFPAPPPNKREVIPERFHRSLVAGYDALLERVEAGSPPPPAEVEEAVRRKRSRFLSEDLAKSEDDPLTPSESERMLEELRQQRITLYAKRADDLGMYVDVAALGVPAWDQGTFYTMAELYDWQWRYWIIEDVLEALASANRGSGSIQRAPLKRVLSLYIEDDMGVLAASQGGPSGGGDSGGAFGLSARGSGGGRKAEPPSGPVGGAPNPAREVKPDYTLSLTGRTTNPLYDVRMVDLDLVVDGARLPEVLDALARRNFITVVDVEIFPEDLYEAARDGYFYGNGALSRVRLRLETIWLREWMTPFMPDALKEAKGIPVKPPAPRS